MNHYEKNMTRNKSAPNSWCPLPWTHISIKNDGVYRICCHSNSGFEQGVLRDQNKKNLHISQSKWENVINSDRMKTVRKNMLKGVWSKECIRCKREFETGMKSRNLYERKTLAELVEPKNYPSYTKTKQLTQEDGSISFKDFPISYLDIRFGNLCNLKCLMCGPTDSNKWYDDYYQLWEENYFTDHGNTIKLEKRNGAWKTEKNIYNWSEDPQLWAQIEKHIHIFRKIFIVGGEPLLIKPHYDFLKKCIEKNVSHKLTIEYNSNITEIPDKAWPLWKPFKTIRFSISLDGFGKTNDFIRYPSQWERVKKNLNHFDTIGKPFEILITPSISVLNVWHLPLFIEYIMKKNYKTIGIFSSPLLSPHPVHNPLHLNINILEDSFKEKIIARFNNYKEKISQHDWQAQYGNSHKFSWEKKINSAIQILDCYIKYIHKISFSKEQLTDKRKTFIYYMDKLDKIRNTNWKETLPELYENTLNWRKY